jgi:hypothetical protein
VALVTAQLQLARKRDRFRSQIGQPCTGSVDAFEEFTRRNPKPASDTHEGREADVPLAALQPADLGRMQVARGGQVFLRQIAFLAACLDVLAESLLRDAIRGPAASLLSSLHGRDAPARQPKAPEQLSSGVVTQGRLLSSRYRLMGTEDPSVASQLKGDAP